MLTTEIKLLLDCLRNDPADVKSRYLETLSREGWHAVFAQAKRHSAVPMLYHALKTAFLGLDVPPDVAEELKKSYYANAQRNMLAYRQLENILADFNKKDIPVILLKGAHLAKFVYANIALRPMVDFDLLVRPQDLHSGCEILISHGYEAPVDGLGISEQHAPPFRNKDKGKIELHFNIADAGLAKRFSIEEIWARAGQITIGETTAYTLCPEDLLIHICIHSCIGHGCDNAMKALLDVRQIVEHFHEVFDWDKLLCISRQLQVTNAVYFMLFCAQKLLGLSIDDQTLAAIRPDDEGMISRAEGLMFGARGQINSHISRLFGEKKWSVKMHYFFRRLLPAKESMTYAGDAGRSPLFYFKAYLSRIRYLFRRYGVKTLRFVLKDKKMTDAIEEANEKNTVRDWLAS